MCYQCVEEYAKDEGLTDVSVPAELKPLVERIRAFYELPDCSAGGPLHIVLDDTNVEDDHIEWCLNEGNLERYSPEVAKWARQIAADLLRIKSLTMRAAVTMDAM